MRGTQEPLAQSSMQSGLEEKKKIQLMPQDRMRQSAITPILIQQTELTT